MLFRSRVLEELNKDKAGKGKNFQMLSVNVGSDDRKNISVNGRGRYFKPFGESFGFQAQGEYYYIRGQREGQFDFGLVDRFNKRVQAGLFASFKSDR